MAIQTTCITDDTASSVPIGLLASWRRHLTAQRMSRATLDSYSASVLGLDRFLVATRPAASLEIRRAWRGPPVETAVCDPA
ncbi:MAG: hypothetical protein ABJC39_01925 [Chloroflexota bacterium]